MTKKRIGVVSDTHGRLPEEVFALFHDDWTSDQLAEAVVKHYVVKYDAKDQVILEDVWPQNAVEPLKCDLILHAGDIGTQSALDDLGAICRTVAVLGNNDRTPYWCSDGDVPDFRTLTWDSIDIAMMHIPDELRLALHGRSPTVLPAVQKMPQLAVHGHTHVPEIHVDGNTIVLCPGSPTQSRRSSGHNAVLIDAEDSSMTDIYFVALP